MKVLVSGARGLIGKELSEQLKAKGHEVLGLSRSAAGPDFVRWDPKKDELKPEDIDGCEAVVHLAGENIASGRWDESMKAKIRESRIKGTKLLVDRIASLEKKPRVFLGASAIGFYGDRGSEQVDESSAVGKGFLADLCQDWEKSCDQLSEVGVRVVNARIGVVLSTEGGALSKMLTPFKMGAGGQIGSGGQYMSWITVKDVASAIIYLLENESFSGPVNLVAPEPVTNIQFTKALGKVLGRPTIFPVPAFAARIVFGEMADELLLSSTNVEPKVLKDSEFEFSCKQIDEGLKQVLSN